jgi:hypothetical protein
MKQWLDMLMLLKSPFEMMALALLMIMVDESLLKFTQKLENQL